MPSLVSLAATVAALAALPAAQAHGPGALQPGIHRFRQKRMFDVRGEDGVVNLECVRIHPLLFRLGFARRRSRESAEVVQGPRGSPGAQAVRGYCRALDQVGVSAEPADAGGNTRHNGCGREIPLIRAEGG